MAVQAQTGMVRAALADAAKMVEALNLGTSGDRHRTIMRGLDAARRFVDECEVHMGRVLDAATLRDGIALQRALDEAGLGGTIRQMADADEREPARYRVELADGPALDGTVAQIVGIVSLLRGRP